MCAAGRRRFAGRGKFGKAHAVERGFVDLIGGGVVMAGQHRAVATGFGHGTFLMRRAIFCLHLLEVGHVFGKVGIVHAALFRDIGLERGQVAELALAGGVIHQADDADAILGAEGGHFLEQGFRTDLGAQVQEMADLEQSFGTGGQQFVRQLAGIFTVTGF